MNQTLDKKRSLPRIPGAKSPRSKPSPLEERTDLEGRLEDQEADARWRRRKEMLLISLLAFVVLSACGASAYRIFIGSGDGVQVYSFLGYIICILIAGIMGWNIKWRK